MSVNQTKKQYLENLDRLFQNIQDNIQLEYVKGEIVDAIDNVIHRIQKEIKAQ